MKHLVLIFSFLMVGAFSANAQACSKAAEGKACCASKKSASLSMTDAETLAAAELAASVDASIKKNVCEKSGSVSWTQKTVCEKSGSVSWEPVQYDAATQKFTKVGSVSMEKNADGTKTKACSGAKEGASCSKSADKKACCASKKGATK